MPRPRAPQLGVREEGAARAAHMQALRSVLGARYLPPPVVPLRAHVLHTPAGDRLFVELRNLSGQVLEELGIEAVTLNGALEEHDILSAQLCDLGVSGDPRRVVPVGGLPLAPHPATSGAIVTVLFARFGDGSTWQGRLDTLEDPRQPEFERAQACERFFKPYRAFLDTVEPRVAPRDTLC